MIEINIEIKAENYQIFNPKSGKEVDPTKALGYTLYVKQQVKEALDLPDATEVCVLINKI